MRGMGTEFASLFELERAERLQLVEDLWDSLADEGSPLPVAEWKAEELRRRKERLQADPASGRTWDQVKRRARAQRECGGSRVGRTVPGEPLRR